MQRDEYISKFSHELRNPLTLIYSSLQLLEKECPAVRESMLWDQIRKDMVDVIELLKEMSAPFGKLQTAPVKAAEFLSELCASFAPSMELRGIRFSAKLPDELSGIVLNADRQKLRQALTNLLLNAADAVCESLDAGTLRPEPVPSASKAKAPSETSPNANSARPDALISSCPNSQSNEFGAITLFAVPDDTKLCIHVRDNGPGIPQKYLADLFEPFVTHKKNGSGLGLGVAKAIAEQHGGSLSVDTHCIRDNSTPGETDSSATTATSLSNHTESPAVSYTDFCLTIPVCKSDAKPADCQPAH